VRPSIRALYRTDFYEPIARDEMKAATVRGFRTRGHLDPEVSIEVTRVSEDPLAERKVTVRSEAGRRYSLLELEIAGLGDEQAARDAAASFPGKLMHAELAAGRPEAEKRLLGTLSILGWPHAQIDARELADDGKRLVIHVVPGPRQTLASVSVSGVDGSERERLAELLAKGSGVSVGDPARKDRMSTAAQQLEDDLKRRGYADATVETHLTPSPGRPDTEVALAFEVKPGIGYRLADVDVAGGRFSQPRPFLRQADLPTGRPFSQESVEEARTRLFRTGVFSAVDASVLKDPDGEARVTFALTERPRFFVGYGVRWESGEGTAAVLDTLDQNFLGRALTLGLRGLYQDNDRSARVYLRTGGVLGTNLSFETYYQRRRFFPNENQIEDSSEASLQASEPLGRWTTARVYVRHRQTHAFEIEPIDPLFPFDVTTRLPYIGTQIVRDTRDDPIDPRHGILTSADLSGSAGLFQSDFKYIRLFAQLVSFRRVAIQGRGFTWDQGLRLGAAHPFDGQELLRDERFFAGGPYTVRGYDENSLGEIETLGGLVVRGAGGGGLVVINEELRFPLPLLLTGLVFFDAGNVWETPSDISFDLSKSLGLGLRYRSPLGLIRFDAAWALDRRPGDDPYKLYIGFGNAF
jgi:outer membrane protein assembly factor BamA